MILYITLLYDSLFCFLPLLVTDLDFLCTLGLVLGTTMLFVNLYWVLKDFVLSLSERLLDAWPYNLEIYVAISKNWFYLSLGSYGVEVWSLYSIASKYYIYGPILDLIVFCFEVWVALLVTLGVWLPLLGALTSYKTTCFRWPWEGMKSKESSLWQYQLWFDIAS